MKSKTSKPDNSPKVFQRDKIDFDLKIREYPLTAKQQEIIKLALDKDTRIIFLNGPAGSSKSFLGTYIGLTLLAQKKISEIWYVRPIIESADSGARLGFLPGNFGEKIEPYGKVLSDKLEELINLGDAKKLNAEERLQTIPVNYMRGASLTAKYALIDEFQGFTWHEAKTILTRIGKYSKFFICADPSQSDLPLSKQGAFMKLFTHFKDNPLAQSNGIHCVELTKADIMRSDLCAFLVNELEQIDLNYGNSAAPH